MDLPGSHGHVFRPSTAPILSRAILYRHRYDAVLPFPLWACIPIILPSNTQRYWAAEILLTWMCYQFRQILMVDPLGRQMPSGKDVEFERTNSHILDCVHGNVVQLSHDFVIEAAVSVTLVKVVRVANII